MDLLTIYHQVIQQILRDVAEQERAAMEAASEILASAYAEDRLIHICGAGGHSAIGAMEIFYRAGGLTRINAMFPVGTNIITAFPTTGRITGLAPYTFRFYGVQAGDPLILVNFYGLNPSSVDLAQEAKRRGVHLITVNSHAFARKVPQDFQWRHPSKQNIHELADVAIDNHVPLPDAVLHVDGVEEPVTPTATIATCFALNCLMTETIRKIAARGVKPDVWISNNVPGCDEHNGPMIEKERWRIHHLYPVTPD
jgi:uncharacterized phosphosugar-binding protein